MVLDAVLSRVASHTRLLAGVRGTLRWAVPGSEKEKHARAVEQALLSDLRQLTELLGAGWEEEEEEEA